MTSDAFGQLLVEQLRDAAIRNLDSEVDRLVSSAEFPCDTKAADALTALLRPMANSCGEVLLGFLQEPQHGFLRNDWETWIPAASDLDLGQVVDDEVINVAVRGCVPYMNYNGETPYERCWHHICHQTQVSDAAYLAIPQVVDAVVSQTAFWLDTPERRLTWVRDNVPRTYPPDHPGETHVFYSGNGGWIEAFSTERYFRFSETDFELVFPNQSESS